MTIVSAVETARQLKRMEEEARRSEKTTYFWNRVHLSSAGTFVENSFHSLFYVGREPRSRPHGDFGVGDAKDVVVGGEHEQPAGPLRQHEAPNPHDSFDSTAETMRLGRRLQLQDEEGEIAEPGEEINTFHPEDAVPGSTFKQLLKNSFMGGGNNRLLSSTASSAESSNTDTRPACSSVEQANQSLLCLPYSTSEYENYYGLFGTFCFEKELADNSTTNWCISVGGILLAILVANTLQFFYENLFLYMSVLDESYDFQEAYRKCFSQFFVIFTHSILFVTMLGPFHQASRMDKVEQIMVTFALVFFFDQVKNLLIQPVIWYLVIRRCGRVQPGIQEYNEEYLLQWELQESLLDEMQRRTREFLEKRTVLVFIIGLVGFYASFLMLSIVISDCWKLSDEPNECKTSSLCPGLSEQGRLSLYYAFTYLDFCIMLLFVLEIALKLFGYGTTFILDPWNFFDSVIVLVSFICWFVFLGSTVGTTGLGLLRLLRLVRVMVMISDSRRKLKKVTKTLADGAKSHVERVLELLEKLQNLKIPAQTGQDLEWIVDMILENKLYKVSVDDPTEDEGKSKNDSEKNDASMTAWIQQLGDGTANSSGTATAAGMGGSGEDNVRGTYVAQSQVRGSFANRGSVVNR
ncbi:unnamed protein product, partial [Amoebophrya sp. A120]|eukprot:GSA120T00016081001.1